MRDIEISEKALIRISWGAIFTISTTICTVVLWLSSVDSKASDAMNRVDMQKDSIREIREDVTKIKESVYRSEGILEMLKKHAEKL